MDVRKTTKFGVGAAALVLVGMASVGFAPPPATELPTVTVYHNPT